MSFLTSVKAYGQRKYASNGERRKGHLLRPLSLMDCPNKWAVSAFWMKASSVNVLKCSISLISFKCWFKAGFFKVMKWENMLSFLSFYKGVQSFSTLYMSVVPVSLAQLSVLPFVIVKQLKSVKSTAVKKKKAHLDSGERMRGGRWSQRDTVCDIISKDHDLSEAAACVSDEKAAVMCQFHKLKKRLNAQPEPM